MTIQTFGTIALFSFFFSFFFFGHEQACGLSVHNVPC